MDGEILTPDDQLIKMDKETLEQDNNSNSELAYDPDEFFNPADFLEEKVIHKRKALTLKEKADIIAAYDENPQITKVQLARRYNLSRTTLHSIIAKRDIISEAMKRFGSHSSLRKKSRTSPFQAIEGKLLLWMKYAKDLKLPVNGYTLRRQAMTIAKELGFENFTASNGWIERFKSRHNDSWKASKSSTTVPKEDKDVHIPIEPTVVIKEEPTDYEPTPSTSKDTSNEEFILPHEDEDSWTATETVLEPQCTLSVAGLGSPKRPADSEQPTKKRKTDVTTHMPSTNGPTSSPQQNLSDSMELRKDQFDAFGDYIAAKLRSMDKVSCAFAQKAIGDIIFEAEMGKYLNQKQGTTS